MKNLLLTLSLSLAALPMLAPVNGQAADDLPPPRSVDQDATDDLPPPRTTTRKPRTAPTEVPPAVATPLTSTAGDLPPPRTEAMDIGDDLPPPRTTTRKPGTAPPEATPAATTLQAGAADDLPPPAASSRKPAGQAFTPTLKYGMDDLLLEAGALPFTSQADAYYTLRAAANVEWQPSREWEFRGGARIDGASQAGGTTDFSDLLADYTETYVRYRSGDTRLTLGAQTVIWGRVDEVPLIDRVSRVDLTRFVLDALPDRRRAQLAARWEQNFGEYKLDALWLPAFRGAQLPDLDSVWSPINQSTGEVIGIASSPAITSLVKSATINQSQDEFGYGDGGGGARLTRTGDAFDLGFTLARTRQSLPYYVVNTSVPSLTATHPFNNFAGADAEFVTGAYTWRMELGYTGNVPATLPNAATIYTSAIDWVGAVEFFPGGKDTRINLQIAGHTLQTGQSVLELDEYYGVNGEINTTFDQGRWNAGIKFASGINVNNVYIGPRISYRGWEPHEIYVAAYYFDGEDGTVFGFHKDHSYLALGWRGKF
jgi:hypothetical protein